jgi:hypothetical protein
MRLLWLKSRFPAGCLPRSLRSIYAAKGSNSSSDPVSLRWRHSIMRGRGGISLACFQTTSQIDPDHRICPWFLYCGTMYTVSEADRTSTSRSFQVFQAYSIRVRPISIPLEQPQGESLPVQHRLYQRRRSLRSMTIHAIETQPEDSISCGRCMWTSLVFEHGCHRCSPKSHLGMV